MPIFQIHHITKYDYDRPVKESISQLRIFPQTNNRQQLQSTSLTISGNPEIGWHDDYYGNRVGYFSLIAPHTELVIDNRLTVLTNENIIEKPYRSFNEIEAAITNDIRLLQLATPEAITEQWMISHILEGIWSPNLCIHDFVWACSEFIYRNFTYEKGITTVETQLDEILHHRSGVCQDFAHVCLQLMRTKGIPARYVSGYICPNKSGLRGEGATHAWVEYFDPEYGWLGIDPTNNVWVGGNHVVMAVGKNFEDCSPVKGTFRGIARQSLSVHVSVGYEDGHTFEDVNKVRMVAEPQEEMEAWQIDWMQSQQQQ